MWLNLLLKNAYVSERQMFQLKETSPAIGKGLSEVNSAAEDFFGNSLKNKVLDIGAQQASTIEKVFVIKIKC